MTAYLSPGVYVKEVSSGLAAIAGVGTSTAGFIGIIPPQKIPLKSLGGQEIKITEENKGRKEFQFIFEPPFGENEELYHFFVDGKDEELEIEDKKTKIKISDAKLATVTFTTAIGQGKKLQATYNASGSGTPKTTDKTPLKDKDNNDITGDGNIKEFTFVVDSSKFGNDKTAYKFYEEGKEAELTVEDNPQDPKITILDAKLATVTFTEPIASGKKLQATYNASGSGTPKTTDKTPLKDEDNNDITGDGNIKEFTFVVDSSKFGNDKTAYKFYEEGKEAELTVEKNKLFNLTPIDKKLVTVEFKGDLSDAVGKNLLAQYTSSLYQLGKVEGEDVGKGDDKETTFSLKCYPVNSAHIVVNAGQGNSKRKIQVHNVDNNDPTKKNSKVTLTEAPKKDEQISVDYFPLSVDALDVKLCTNFTEFKKYFGDFSDNEGQSMLAHAVYGFFRNGGTRCFVTWVASNNEIDAVLEKFEAIDEIAIVAVPGCSDKTTLEKLAGHCYKLGDRFAIFDAPKTPKNSNSLEPGKDDLPGKTEYAALYYPWIDVYDPETKENKLVPPSGHIAGIYARVDTQRGVHKAPANEVVMGATDLQVNLSRAKQDGLNPQGVNCIRNLNGNILVWGARTWGGDGNGEFKYINIRRLFNYLRESIDEGTQWAVFEPNSPELWAKIRRSVTAFLTMVWRRGALFGATPQEAFFVQCDEETNPPEVRDAGQLIIKVGVAVVKPAEFVIFELSQWSGGK